MATEWQDKFKSYSTRVGFNLQLTRPMLEFLCSCADDVYWDRAKFGTIFFPDNWYSTEHALTKRGLVIRKPPQDVKKERANNPDATRGGGLAPPWELTPAGRAVVDLLKVGGLFISAAEALPKMKARKGRL
jgi:hypothetical protein